MFVSYGRPLVSQIFFLLSLVFFFTPSSYGSSTHNHKHHHSHKFRRSPAQLAERNDRSDAPLKNSARALGVLPRVNTAMLLSAQAEDSVRVLATASSGSSTSGDYSCGPNRPCGNGACCGKDGWCGYEPMYCGEGCQSNCTAKAECGTYADPPGKTCPLNVCCSKYGFCGTTAEFCTGGCQSNCEQPKPVAVKTDSRKIVMGYYESWSQNKPCNTMAPSEIPIDYLTHIIFSFAFITPGDFKITNMDGVSAHMYSEVTNLKQRNPELKVLIALGGWTHNDPGKWQKVFSNLASTEANRRSFIKNLLGFMKEYAFDGVDFDWEYPGAKDRGGTSSDGVNFTKLLKELQAEIKKSGHRYIVTFTAPTSYWYLRHFDITETTKYVDWINLMSYDLHGVWDRDNPIGNQVLAHTNITEISLALDLLWRNDIKPSEIVLGLGFYGRSFELTDTKCWKPGCSFSGPGKEGRCSKTAGILTYEEIMDIIDDTKAKPYYDKDAGVNYLVYDNGKSWISYDDPKSFEAKIKFADSLGLNGLMIWAIDLDTSKLDALRSITPKKFDSIEALAFTEDRSVSHATFSSTKCYVKKECGEFCPPGETAMTRVGRGPDHTCPGDKFRYVCCPSFSAPNPDQCTWREGRTSGVPSDCAGVCEIGELKIAGDSWGWSGSLFDGHPGKYCARGGVIFCCKAGNAKRYLDICTWSKCSSKLDEDMCADGKVPGKPYELTKDSGGASDKGFCGSTDKWIDDSPSYPDVYRRSLCCPKKDSFKNCQWHWGKSCSESCPDGKIELAKDPNGPSGFWGACYGNRNMVFCCDPPGGLDRPFMPVSLDRIIPPAYLPPPDSVPLYEARSFGDLTNMIVGSPPLDGDGVGFFLIAGNTADVSSFGKRAVGEPLTFIQCPSNVLEVPDHAPQVARVVCLNEDIESCFRVEEGGVEGTVVEMPPNCAHGTWARAVSLTISKNQKLPRHLKIAGRNPTSKVYDFVFDYNMKLIRRDAAEISIRMDYSNVPGFWGKVVNSLGKGQTDNLAKRYFSGSSNYGGDWKGVFNSLEFDRTGKDISDTSTRLIYFETIDSCPVQGGNAPEGLGAGVRSKVKGDAYYGFSMIANIEGGEFLVREAAGFYRLKGEVDTYFDVAGVGTVDISKANRDNPVKHTYSPKSLGGHTLFKGWATFTPYSQETVGIASKGPQQTSAAEFIGKATIRVKAKFGDFSAHFPDTSSESRPSLVNTIETDKGNEIYDSTNNAEIGILVERKYGLQVQLGIPSKIADAPKVLPDMSMSMSTLVTFKVDSYSGSEAYASCIQYTVSTNVKQMAENVASVNWSSNVGNSIELAKVNQTPQTGKCFPKKTLSRRSQTQSVVTPRKPSNTQVEKRQSSGGGIPGFPDLRLGQRPGIRNIQLNLDYAFMEDRPVIKQRQTYRCSETEQQPDEDVDCCGCLCLWCRYGTSDIPPCSGEGEEGCSNIFGSLFGGILSRRQLGSCSIADRPEKVLTDLIPALEDVSISKDEEEDHGKKLEERQVTITLGQKAIRPCGVRVTSEDYPSFPTTQDITHWHNSVYAGIPAFYGYASNDCVNWSCAKPAQAATQNFLRIGYQTEHVFEAQTITYFFSEWLVNGNLRRPQRQLFPRQIFDCTWTRTFVTNNHNVPNVPWTGKSLAKALIDELGSVNHLDRLVVYMSRPNRMKKNLFDGTSPSSHTTFGTKPPEEQLLLVKDMGLSFSYFNDHPIVQQSFCRVYEAIYDRLGEFDNWYNGNFIGTPSSLQREWRLYIRETLDDFMRAGLAHYDRYYQARGTPIGNGINSQLWIFRWAHNQLTNRPKIHLPWTCNNLPATTVPVPAAGDLDDL